MMQIQVQIEDRTNKSWNTQLCGIAKHRPRSIHMHKYMSDEESSIDIHDPLALDTLALEPQNNDFILGSLSKGDHTRFEVPSVMNCVNYNNT